MRKPFYSRMSSLAPVVVLAASFLPLPDAHAGPDSLKAGEPFPRIELPSLEDGVPLSIERFRGKKLIVHVWASW